MKTKTLLILCFMAAFAVNATKAPNGVIKEEVTYPFNMFLECTGDYIYGQVTYVGYLTPLGWTEQVKKATITGYTDALHTTLSGRSYELSQTDNGKWDGVRGESTARLRMDGKLVAIIRFAWHTTTNANGTITADFHRSSVECR